MTDLTAEGIQLPLLVIPGEGDMTRIPVVPEPVGTVFSHTRISTYADCGLKYRLQYVDVVEREPQGAFLGGIAVHRAVETLEKDGRALVEAYYEPDGPAAELFRDVLAAEVAEAGGEQAVRWGGRKTRAFPGGEDLAWWMQFGPGMVRAWHRMRLMDELEGRRIPPEYVEAQVLCTIGDVALTTRIDALVVDENDAQVYIRDYKTGRERPEQKLQQVLYAHAVRETLDLPVAGAELAYLKTADLRRVRFRTDVLHDTAVRWVEQVVKGVKHKVYPMSPGPFCSSCSVRAHCPWGQALGEDEAAKEGSKESQGNG